MNISNYYTKAKEIGVASGINGQSILAALDYNEDDDQPSIWIPKVQEALVDFYKNNSLFEVSSDALELYIKGEIMKNTVQNKQLLRVGLACLIIGVYLGWLLGA